MNIKCAFRYLFAASVIFTFSCKKDNDNTKSIGCNGITSVMDVDSNIYGVVEIGNQCWMTENLKVTRYRNGSNIINETDNSQWHDLNEGAWCFYNNDPAFDTLYGKLYNWFATTDSRGICPNGWHIPSDAEWSVLTDYLGGAAIAGAQLKDTTHWDINNFYPEGAGTNSSKFTALPGGYRVPGGSFYDFGITAFFWASEYDSKYAWSRELKHEYASVGRGFNHKESGSSCRCLRD